MTGYDLETSEVLLSVIFYIIEKNASSECKGNKIIVISQQSSNNLNLLKDSNLCNFFHHKQYFLWGT